MNLISEPGVYALPEAEYHADPCKVPSLSASAVRALLDGSAMHVRHGHPRLNPDYVAKDSTKFDVGKAAHSMMLYQAEHIVVVEADDWRTKAAKEERDAAYAAGAIPLLREQYDQVEAMVQAARAQLHLHQAGGAFGPGLNERTVIWEEDGAWCRVKPDWMPTKAGEGMIVYDFKTTAVAAREWGDKLLWQLGGDIRAAFYTRGLRHILRVDDIRYRFVVVEVDPPHGLAVYEIPAVDLALAGEAVNLAIQRWRWCMANDKWAGYGNAVRLARRPKWDEAKLIARLEGGI